MLNRPQLQGLLCKLGCVISLLLGLAYKLNDPSLPPVGLVLTSTLSYSIGWCFMFTDSLISLRFKLSAIQGSGGGYEHMLDIISRAHIPMMLLEFVCFSMAPVTFLFPNALKFSLANVVFAVEAALFALYAVLIVFVVLYRLDIELQRSVDFLQQQCQLFGNIGNIHVQPASTPQSKSPDAVTHPVITQRPINNHSTGGTCSIKITIRSTTTSTSLNNRTSILTERLEKFRILRKGIRTSGIKNAIQYTVLFVFRLLCILEPHWFIFLLAFEMVCLIMSNISIDT